MVRAFHRPRAKALTETRWGRYLRYAAGEVALIFVGITLALWFDSWNEQRHRRSLELATIGEIAGNLRANVDTLQANMAADQSSVSDCQRIIDLMDDRRPWLDMHSPMMFNCRRWSSPFLQGAGYESLRLRGTELISDRRVRYSIIELYENTYAFLIGDIERAQWMFESAVWTPVYVRYMEHRNRDSVRPSDYDQLTESAEFRNAISRHMSLLEASIVFQEHALEETLETIGRIEPERPQ